MDGSTKEGGALATMPLYKEEHDWAFVVFGLRLVY